MARRLFALVIAAGLLASGNPVAAQTRQGYVLGPDDQIEIQVFGQPDLTVKTRVKANGSITMPVIGSLRAEGNTVNALADAIAMQLKTAGVVRQPVVNVEVAAYVSRAVTVLGAVGAPGIYPLDREQTLSSVLARAGGVRGDGSERLQLRRAGGGDARMVEIATLAADPKADVALQPGDVVYVPVVEQFFIYGQVGAPGSYPIIAGMTLRQALARGGGPTLAGTERRVTLYRTGRAAAEADLNAVVQKGDVLLVRERTF